MKLSSPIIIDNLTITDLDIVIHDYHKEKIVLVKFHPSFRPLLLWGKNEYDEIGDYTQNQIENKILQILGDNPLLVLSKLYNPSKTQY